ncbi:TIGR02117 family protein [Devosia sp.]|uniref:TIGR02117 family protein n=1 Tax=Devosia sp. TaxID=1871048 RepID=UPI003F70CEBF
MRVFKRIALVLVLLLGLPALAVLLGAVIPHPAVFEQPDGTPLARRLLMVSNPIHTDIAIPLNAQSLTALPFLATTGLPIDHPEARWLLIGWGGRAFYLETPSFAEMKPGPTFKALTLDRSVMHVDVLGAVDEANPMVTSVDLSEAGYARMLSEIASSFTRDAGKVLPIDGYALTGSDRFYEAEGSFNAIFVGCNSWTGRMLRSAGVRTGLWTPLPTTLAGSIHLFNRLPETAPAR